jgi:hypothetical protein
MLTLRRSACTSRRRAELQSPDRHTAITRRGPCSCSAVFSVTPTGPAAQPVKEKWCGRFHAVAVVQRAPGPVSQEHAPRNVGTRQARSTPATAAPGLPRRGPPDLMRAGLPSPRRQKAKAGGRAPRQLPHAPGLAQAASPTGTAAAPPQACAPSAHAPRGATPRTRCPVRRGVPAAGQGEGWVKG